MLQDPHRIRISSNIWEAFHAILNDKIYLITLKLDLRESPVAALKAKRSMPEIPEIGAFLAQYFRFFFSLFCYFRALISVSSRALWQRTADFLTTRGVEDL